MTRRRKKDPAQRRDGPSLSQQYRNDATSKLVDRFLAWPLPATVCSDMCVTDREYKFPRSGTNLLSADEARQMFEYLFAKPL